MNAADLIRTDDGLVCWPLVSRPHYHHHPVNHALKARGHHVHHSCHHGHLQCFFDLGGPAGGSVGDTGGALEDAGGGGALFGSAGAGAFGDGFGGGGSEGGSPLDGAQVFLTNIVILTGGGPCVPALPIPELSTTWLLLIGAAVVFAVRKWRKRSVAQ